MAIILWIRNNAKNRYKILFHNFDKILQYKAWIFSGQRNELVKFLSNPLWLSFFPE